jgi:hypothetical protein
MYKPSWVEKELGRGFYPPDPDELKTYPPQILEFLKKHEL